MKRGPAIRTPSTREPTETALRACLIAKDASFNLRDYISTASRMAFLAVKQCEKELDQIERQIDESTPAAITQVTETEARELLTCLKFTIDLERIGDLIWSVAHRLHQLPRRLDREERGYLTGMAETLQEMVSRVWEAFSTRNLTLAKSVLKMDSRMDEACHEVFRRYLKDGARSRSYEVTNLLFMAQALERAGDHTKNLAEELFHLVEGHSVRHLKKSR